MKVRIAGGLDIGGTNTCLYTRERNGSTKSITIPTRDSNTAEELLGKLHDALGGTKLDYVYAAISGPVESNGTATPTVFADKPEAKNWAFSANLINQILARQSILGNDIDGQSAAIVNSPELHHLPWSGKGQTGDLIDPENGVLAFGTVAVGTGVGTNRTTVIKEDEMTRVLIQRSEWQHRPAVGRTPIENLILNSLNDGKDSRHVTTCENILRGDGLEVIFNSLLELGKINSRSIKKIIDDSTRNKKIHPSQIITDFANGTNKTGCNINKKVNKGCKMALNTYMGMLGHASGDLALETNVILAGGVPKHHMKDFNAKNGTFRAGYEARVLTKNQDNVKKRPVMVARPKDAPGYTAYGNLLIAESRIHESRSQVKYTIIDPLDPQLRKSV